MGQRHKSLAFLPGKFVFPGGRVSIADRRLKVSSDLNPLTRDCLLTGMRGRPSEGRARALALAALRETFEETGYLVGQRRNNSVPSRSKEWRPFFDEGVAPRLEKLRFVARAITPPDRVRRFDTRFFCVSANEIAHCGHARHDELINQQWLTVEQACDRDIIPITREILNHLKDIFTAGKVLSQPRSVPFYFVKNGVRRKEFIAGNRIT